MESDINSYEIRGCSVLPSCFVDIAVNTKPLPMSQDHDIKYIQFNKFEELKDLFPKENRHPAKFSCQLNHLPKLREIKIGGIKNNTKNYNNNNNYYNSLLSLTNAEILKHEEECKIRHKVLKQIGQLIKEIKLNGISSTIIDQSITKLKGFCFVKNKDKLKKILHIYKDLAQEFKKFKCPKDLSISRDNEKIYSNFIFKMRHKNSQKLLLPLPPDKTISLNFPNKLGGFAHLNEMKNYGRLKLSKIRSQKKVGKVNIDLMKTLHNINKDKESQLINFLLKTKARKLKNNEGLSIVELPHIESNEKEADKGLMNIESMNAKIVHDKLLSSVQNLSFRIDREKNKNLISQNNISKQKSDINFHTSVKIYNNQHERIYSKGRNSIISKNIIQETDKVDKLHSENKSPLRNKRKNAFSIKNQLTYFNQKTKKRNNDSDNIMPNLVEYSISKDYKIEGWDCNASQSPTNFPSFS